MNHLKIVPTLAVEHQPFPEDIKASARIIVETSVKLHNRLNELDRDEYPALAWAQITLQSMLELSCAIHNATIDHDAITVHAKALRARADELNQVRADLTEAGA